MLCFQLLPTQMPSSGALREEEQFPLSKEKQSADATPDLMIAVVRLPTIVFHYPDVNPWMIIHSSLKSATNACVGSP